MADKEIIKKGCCFICGADVFIKKSKKNTAYYACNGETSAKSCGSRVFFGAMPSYAMLSQTTQEEENNVRVQSGRQTDIENYIDNARKGEAPDAAPQGGGDIASAAGTSAGKPKSSYDPSRWWDQSE